jgi:translocation and assembly module TamB
MNRKRVRKILLRSLIGLAALGLILATALWLLVGTQGGTEWLFTRLGTLMPGSLEVAELKGPLRGPLDIRGLVYKRDGFEMHVDHVQLEWRLRELAQRRLDIQQLWADGIRIVPDPTPDETKESGPLPDINLRFNIIVRDARVTNMAIGGPGEKPFVIDRIDLDTTDIQNNVKVNRLAVRAPLFDADATGTVRPQGDYPVNLDLRWTARPPDLAAFSGGGRLTGTLEELKVVQELRAPVPARLNAVLFQPLYKLRFDGRLRFQDLDPRRIRADFPAVPASGDVAIQGNLEEFTSQGQILAQVQEKIQDVALGQVSATYRLARNGDQWRIEKADIGLPGTPARLTAQGLVTLKGKDVNFQGDASWRQLSWPLRGGPKVASSAQGSARVEGDLQSYKASLRADLAGAQIPPGRWSLDGTGTQTSFRFRSLQGDVLAGRISGQGEVAWKPQVRWNASLRGDGIQPGRQWEGFPGSLSFTAASRGELRDAGPYGTVDIPRLQGNVRGEPVVATARLELGGATHRLSRLDARWSSAQLSAAGLIGDRLDLTWSVNAPNLGAVLPGGAGAVTARGRVSGPLQTPRIQATAHGQDLRLSQTDEAGATSVTSIASVETVADVDLSPNGRIDLDLRSTGIQSGQSRIEELTVAGNGSRGAHEIVAAARNDQGRLDLTMAGGLDTPKSWRGQIRRLDLTSKPTGNWRLAGAAPLAASAERVQVRDFCWVSGGARLCATGGWAKAGAWNVDSSVSDFPLSFFKAWLPPDLQVTGDLNGTVRANGAASGLATAQVALTPGPGEIRFPGEGGRTVTFRYEQGLLQARAGTAAAGEATARLVLAGVGTVNANAVLPRFTRGAPLSSQPLRGKIDVNVNDLAFLEGFVPDLHKPKGALTVDYALSGTLGTPQVAGTARLQGGSADVPRFGLELREIQVAATGNGSGSLDLQASLRSGPGTINITGKTGLVPGPEAPVRLAIRGQRFQAMDTEEINALVSPDLNVTYAGQRVEIQGEVVVPKASVEIEKREKGSVAASKDVVFVNAQNQPAPDKSLATSARVRIVLGREVEIAVLGLKAKPTGSILAIEEPGKVTRGVGELVLNEGTFKAYGQDLKIERGRLVFAGGPISNPGVDVRASRTAKDGTVAGINAKGTVQSPEVTLWSDPPMAQGDALAYLLLGRPLNQAQPQEGDRLANAATALGLRGGNLLAKKLAARFGLEEARIESENGSLEQASLVVGRYLSPRLYVTYGLGLFDAANTFRIRYLLNPKLTLQAESGAGTSADLLYTVERGKVPKPAAPPEEQTTTERERPAPAVAAPAPVASKSRKKPAR